MGLKHITVLGSTGSVGAQALDIARFHQYPVDAIAFGKNIQLGEKQIRLFHPQYAAIEDEKAAKALSFAVKDTGTKIFSGKDGIYEMLERLSSDVCIHAISGFDGLRPALAAICRFPRIGLANKETIVVAGDIVMKYAAQKGCEIIPVDSEHSAIFQCLAGKKNSEVRRILLTCSGGPFFGMKPDELASVTVEQALGHPTWKMGAKITVDCATLMNKGLEIIEAMHLFGVSPDKIKVLIHRESIIHSMVEYNDMAVIAQLSASDMRLPIQYAITYPDRISSPCSPLDFTEIGKLTFYEPDRKTFPLLALAESAARCGGLLPCVMNAANEEAVSLFLHQKISFTDIFQIVEEYMKTFSTLENPSISDIEQTNIEVRQKIREQFHK